MEVSDFTECELLTFSTLIVEKFAKTFDTDTLNFWADLFSSLGANMTMLANQRDRIAAAVSAKISKKQKC